MGLFLYLAVLDSSPVGCLGHDWGSTFGAAAAIDTATTASAIRAHRHRLREPGPFPVGLIVHRSFGFGAVRESFG